MDFLNRGVCVVSVWILLEIVFICEASLNLWTTTYIAVGNNVTLSCTSQEDLPTSLVVMRKNKAKIIEITVQNDTGCIDIKTYSNTSYEYKCGTAPVRVVNLTIPASSVTEEQHGSIWQCFIAKKSASNKLRLNISVPVKTVTLTTPKGQTEELVIEAGKEVQFTCATGPSRPAVEKHAIRWFRNNEKISGKSNITVTQDDGDKFITIATLFVEGRREDNDSDIKCSATNLNPRSSIQSNPIRLIVYWKPSGNATISGYRTGSRLQEDSTLTLNCSVRAGKPLAEVSWSGICSRSAATTKLLPNMSVSEIKMRVNRSYNGKYCTCTAKHPVQSYKSSQSVKFTVTYPPLLQVRLQNTTENNSNVTIRCIGDGEPSNLTITAWNQIIAGTIVRSTTDFEHVSKDKTAITLSNVSFADAGLYTCKATNGIPDKNNVQEQSGSSYLDVKVSAKYDPNPRQRKFYGIVGNLLSVKVPFYSNPRANQVLWFNKTSIMTLSSTSSSSVSSPQSPPSAITFSLKDDVIITKIVFGKVLTLQGQAAEMNISTFSEYHEGNYSLIINNSEHLVSSTNIVITSSGPPDTPKSLSISSVTSYIIVLHWERGFNRGHKQTFVVNLTEAESMKNVLDSKETEEIDGESNYYMTFRDLKPDTNYIITINAYNQVGSSSFRSILISTTAEAALSTVIILGAVASISLALIFIFIIGAFTLKGRLTKNTGNNNGQTKVRHAISHDDDLDDGMKPNIIFESAGPYFASQSSNSTDNNDFDYVVGVSAPDKERNAIYAVVNKLKKSTINSGASSCAELDQSYGNWKGGGNSIRGKSDAVFIQSKPSRKKNKEGLDYVEVVLKDTSSDQNVRVIHGIEKRNDYADIDFSRHAVALLSDDDEDAMPCVNPRDDTTSL